MGTTVAVKERITAAFKALRAKGFIARQGFMCCCGCAGAALANALEGMSEAKRGKVSGAVFYTRQDADRMDRRGEFEGVYLAFGPVESSKFGVIGSSVFVVGHTVVDTLRAAGLRVEWDGTAKKKIWIAGVA